MTAFLFVPSATGAGQERRIDVANLARMFAETEEPAPRRARGELARVLMLVLILFGMIGDAVLVTRPRRFRQRAHDNAASGRCGADHDVLAARSHEGRDVEPVRAGAQRRQA